MNNLILVRHGQSFWNKERRFTGWADIELTEQGKSEARLAGRLIKKLNIEFHTYFTSQLKRAINSLEIILEILNKQNADLKKILLGKNFLNNLILLREHCLQKLNQIWVEKIKLHS